MRNTHDIAFYCRASHQNSRGEAPIEMSIIVNGERKFINLPMKVKPSDFNRRRQPKEIQDFLSLIRVKVNEGITELIQDGQPITAQSIRQYIRNGGIPTYTVERLVFDYLDIQKRRVGLDLTLPSYRKMERMREIIFSNIDKEREANSVIPSDIQSLYLSLLSKYSTNTAASYMDKVKAVFSWGISNGHIKKDPFVDIKIKREKNEIEFLTDEEVHTILTTPLSTQSLERVRDCFVVQLSTGLSFIDLESLREEDIRTEGQLHYIQKKRVKTSVPYTAIILPFAIPILEKYNYHLPLISNQKTNSALKAIARECHIDKNVYSHLARKTYGNFLLNGYQIGKEKMDPVGIDIVAKCLGHSTTRTTARYYATVHTDSVLRELSKALHQKD